MLNIQHSRAAIFCFSWGSSVARGTRASRARLTLLPRTRDQAVQAFVTHNKFQQGKQPVDIFTCIIWSCFRDGSGNIAWNFQGHCTRQHNIGAEFCRVTIISLDDDVARDKVSAIRAFLLRKLYSKVFMHQATGARSCRTRRSVDVFSVLMVVFPFVRIHTFVALVSHVSQLFLANF